MIISGYILIFILGFVVFSFIITIIITLFINKSRTSELEKYTNQIKNDDVIKSISKNMQNIALSNNKHSNKNIFLSNSFSVLSSYVQELKQIKENLDDDIDNAINLLLDSMKNLDEYIKENTSKSNEIKIMADHYIAELIKNIKIYIKISEKSKNTAQKDKMKKELIETINIINNAFATVLSEFYDSVALSVSSSLAAINQSIKLKGYIK